MYEFFKINPYLINIIIVFASEALAFTSNYYTFNGDLSATSLMCFYVDVLLSKPSTIYIQPFHSMFVNHSSI